MRGKGGEEGGEWGGSEGSEGERVVFIAMSAWWIRHVLFAGCTAGEFALIIFPSTDTFKSMWHSAARKVWENQEGAESRAEQSRAVAWVRLEEPQLPLHAKQMRSGRPGILRTAAWLSSLWTHSLRPESIKTFPWANATSSLHSTFFKHKCAKLGFFFSSFHKRERENMQYSFMLSQFLWYYILLSEHWATWRRLLWIIR